MPREEIDAISIPEMRRRVDHAVGVLREMRRALAVHAGMTLEGAPRPVPDMQLEEGQASLEQIMASLPLLRKRLTPEEKAKLRPISAARNEQLKEVADELVANKEAYEELAKEADLPLSYEQVVKLRESFDKTEMLEEVEREVRAFTEDLKAYQDRLEEQLAEDLAKIASKAGPLS